MFEKEKLKRSNYLAPVASFVRLGIPHGLLKNFSMTGGVDDWNNGDLLDDDSDGSDDWDYGGGLDAD